jgi:hypothetical protein
MAEQLKRHMICGGLTPAMTPPHADDSYSGGGAGIFSKT